MKRAALAAVLLTGCGGPLHQIVEDTRDLAQAGAAPVITEITDLGGSDVPLRGQLKLEGSDGVATIGETLWVRGRSFGRLPTVRVGGRPATVLGRTRDGGALLRVPIGTPSGAQPVEVSNDSGHGAKTVVVRRYAGALMPHDGRVAWAEVTADGPVAIGETPVEGGRYLALSPDGRAAYVAEAARSTVTVVEIPAPGGPRAAQTLALGPEPVLALLAAARAPIVALVRAADVAVLDVSYPLRPARTRPRGLPKEVQDGALVGVDISPDGRRLAVITARDNQVLILDFPAGGPLTVLGKLDLVPQVRAPVLVDVAFSPDGQSVWVLAGDTEGSRGVGPQATQLFALRLLGDGPLRLELARSVTIDAAADPVAVSAGRPLPLASGSAIRLPPERSTVFVSARQRSGSGADPAAPAAVFRVSAQETATPAANAAGLFGKVDLSPDGRWLLVPASAAGGGVRLLSAPADARPGATRTVAFPGGAATGVLRAPALRVQP